MKKNILIVTYAYPPNNVAGAQRPYAIAKLLNKDIFRVTVITCANPHLSIGKNEGFEADLDKVEVIKIKSFMANGIRPQASTSKPKITAVFRIKQLLLKLSQNLIFPDKGMFWYPNVIQYLHKNKHLVEEADVVFSTSPGVTNHRIARWVKRNNPKIKWVADFRDFNYVQHWAEKKSLRSYLHGKLERTILEEASVITFVTQTMQYAYQAFYPSLKDKMHNIYNGFFVNDFRTPQVALLNSEHLSFFYAGTFYGGIRSPKPLLALLDQALSEGLIDMTDLQVNIAGNIDDDTKKGLMGYKSFGSINFLGSISRSQVLKQMNDSTFLWLIVGNIKSHYQTVPIKLFEYIAARRPIINFAPGESEVSEVIRKNNLGYNIDTLNFNLEDSYIIFKNIIKNFRNGMHQSALPLEDFEKFTWQSQIIKLEEIIES